MAERFQLLRGMSARARDGTHARADLSVVTGRREIKWGTPVIASNKGVQHGLPIGTTGVALGTTSDGRLLWVARKNHHVANTWSPTDWEAR